MVVFGTTHEAPWTLNKVAIGISDAQLMDFKTKSGKARGTFDAAEQARLASKAATETYYAAVAALRASAADCVRTIQNKAKSTGDPAIYGLAEIPSPDPRSATAPPPAQPFDIRAQVNGDGSLTLFWKASNPRGVSSVVYKVQRGFGAGPFNLLDTSGGKTYNDDSIPVGTNSVSYIVTGKRGGQSGPMSEIFTARFGSVAGGGMFITGTSVSPSTGVKMAA